MQPVGQAVGEQQPVARCRVHLVIQAHDAVQLGLLGLALQAAAPVVVGVHQPHGRIARALHGSHLGQARHLVQNLRRAGLGQADDHVPAQHLVELGGEQHGNRVAPKGPGNDNRHRYGNAQRGERGAQRAALHGAQNHAGARTQSAVPAPAFQQQRFVNAGRGRAHGLGRR